MSNKETCEKLFQEELEILKTAACDVVDEKYQGNELIPHYLFLQTQYGKLLKLTQKIFRISDCQGRVMNQHQNDIKNLLDNANQGFLTFGRDFKVDLQFSAECTCIFNRNVGGVSILELLMEQECVEAEEWRAAFEAVFEAASPASQEQVLTKKFPSVVKIGDKDVRIECKLIYRSSDEGEQALLMMILTNITEQRKAEAEIQYLSYHDKLTSLYNRAYIEKILLNLQESGSSLLSIIVIDINGLKLANDVFGHAQGDRLLVAMGQVLRKVCRQTDTIARWGGDEFLILLPQTDSGTCEMICNRIHEVCAQTENSPIRLSAAIGTASSDNVVIGFAELFVVAENRMYSNKLAMNRDVRAVMITEMENLLRNHCVESIGHSERVLELATRFAAALGDPAPVDMKPLKQLAALHDIGKVAIPREILDKSGKLTPDEWELVKSHSEIGYRMAQSIGESDLADVVLALHERWDGKGYPGNVSGEQIPLLARLFSLVDVYDTLTHDRPYAGAMNAQDALREISAGNGSQFDPGLTEHFLNLMKANTY